MNQGPILRSGLEVAQAVELDEVLGRGQGWERGFYTKGSLGRGAVHETTCSGRRERNEGREEVGDSDAASPWPAE